LQPVVPAPLAQQTTSGVEPARYCREAVALPLHRMMAATLDFSMVAIAAGIFFSLFYALGGMVVLNGVTTPVLGAAAFLLVVFYKALWLLAGGDTPGMSWCSLRLLNFDGFRPTRLERLRRCGATCLSLAAGGLGVLWALGDEEKLGWNDHLSKTFPSPKPQDKKTPRQ